LAPSKPIPIAATKWAAVGAAGTHGVPERLHVLGVERHVPNLVFEHRHQPTPKRGRRVGEREDRPRHQLRRLQLVVDERMKQPRALGRVAQPARRR
jgi:hypothetical protein